jgi:hypothetical protein
MNTLVTVLAFGGIVWAVLAAAVAWVLLHDRLMHHRQEQRPRHQ